MRRGYGPKARTVDDRRAALLHMLTYRDTLDGLTAEGLEQSYGLPEAMCAAMLAEAELRLLARERRA